MNEDVPDQQKKGAVRNRKARPEVQIYRPGMKRQQPLSSTLPPEPEARKKTTSNNKLNISTDRLSEDNRRRSNDSESTYSHRDDSGSTTPDAMSLCSERMDRTRTFTRGGGRMKNDKHDDCRSDKSQRPYRPNTKQYETYTASPRGSRNDLHQEYQDRRSAGPPRTPYDSTQSLYDSRKSGGYLDSTRPSYRGGRFEYRSDSRVTPNGRFQRQSGERSSLRAELGQRRVNGRRVRNDSINSTQSEIPMTNTEIVIDTSETQSQSGAGPDSSSSLSYYQLCKSFESMGSFDWSKEMEMQSTFQVNEAEPEEKNESSTAEQNQEEHAKQLQKRLAACNTGVEIQEVVRNNRNPVKGIIRLSITDNSQLPGVANQNRAQHPRSNDHYRNDYGMLQHRSNNHIAFSDFDDRASSISGSIVEEEECDELASGERTPTKDTPDDRRWSSRGGRQNKVYPQRRKFTTTGAENDDPIGKTPPPIPKYRGGHDYNREDGAEKGARLQGRLSLTSQPTTDRKPARIASQGVGHYQPPAVRKMQGSGVASSDVRVSYDSDGEMSDQPQRMQDHPVYAQIQHKEGAQIQQLNNTIRDLLPLVAKNKDVDAAKKLVNCSQELSKLYYSVLVINLKFTFGCNLEKSLWNQGFHKIIDCLKTATNSTHPNVKHLRAVFLEFLGQSIDYFHSLVALYETNYHFSLTEILQYWSNGLPSDDFKCVVRRDNIANNQLAVKSCSRLLVSLGDLHRYQTLVNGSEDYSISRSFYLKSVCLWPSSGHAYNQLAVVAYFSERVLDEIYYSIRAVASQYPFETSKERLYTRFGAMRKKVSKYEQLLNNEMGAVIGESEIAVHADRPRELWVAVDGVVEPDKSIYSSYLQQDPCQLHRRVISYLVDTAGLLLTKIGMDQFSSVSERAISQLAALITMADSPMTAQQLIQVAIVFIYVAHSTAKKVTDVDTISLQHQLAVQTVISLFGALLQPIPTHIEEVRVVVSDQEKASVQVIRVLPALLILSEWIMSPSGSDIIRSVPSVEPLSNSTVELDTWGKLGELATNLLKIDDLPLVLENGDTNCPYQLPELLFTASFLDVFPSTTATLFSKEKDVCSSGLRIGKLRTLCQHLCNLNVLCVYFDEDTRVYRKYTMLHVENNANTMEGTSSEEPFSKSLSRAALLSKEQKKRQQIFVVSPSILVPDTNVFVDHLDKLKLLVESNRFKVFICTIVMEELLGLCQVRAGEVQNPHEIMVTANAKIAVSWLKEIAKEKNNLMGTLTTQGQKIALRLVSEETGDVAGGVVNDDRILKACILYAERNPVLDLPASVKLPLNEAPAIVRNLVLLSEDRGICIKATTQNIPSRTIQSFVRWAKLI